MGALEYEPNYELSGGARPKVLTAFEEKDRMIKFPAHVDSKDIGKKRSLEIREQIKTILQQELGTYISINTLEH